MDYHGTYERFLLPFFTRSFGYLNSLDDETFVYYKSLILKQYYCKTCDLIFDDFEYVDHIKEHTEVPQNLNCVCGKHFGLYREFLIHFVECNILTVYVSLCGYYVCSLIERIIMHMHDCEYCSNEFSDNLI